MVACEHFSRCACICVSRGKWGKNSPRYPECDCLPLVYLLESNTRQCDCSQVRDGIHGFLLRTLPRGTSNDNATAHLESLGPRRASANREPSTGISRRRKVRIMKSIACIYIYISFRSLYMYIWAWSLRAYTFHRSKYAPTCLLMDSLFMPFF